jgi:hypothetical protein
MPLAKSKTPPLEDLRSRIESIRAEADAFLDAKAEELKAQIPGVPLQISATSSRTAVSAVSATPF